MTQENQQMKSQIRELEELDMTRFSESKIDEHLKNVLIQKNNKIELLENEVLEKDLEIKEQQEQTGTLKENLLQKEQTFQDLSVRYHQSSQKKEKLKVNLKRNMSNT